MIQTDSFWQRPYWQRLAFGAVMVAPIAVIFVLQLASALVLETLKAIWQVICDAGRHLLHVAKFYRFDVLSPQPSKHLPKPDPDYWEAQ